ncbi:MAG: beta-propeller fold lactonase family protein [Bacteroidia bacterium]
MERKIWLLTLFAIFNSLQVLSQGFEFIDCDSFSSSNNNSSEYCIYNFNPDSTLNIPPYTFAARKAYRESLIKRWYLNRSSNGHTYITHYAVNRNTGRNLHYVNNGAHTVIVCPESNSLICANNGTNNVISSTISSTPFGIAISEKRSEIYVSGLFSRSILVVDLNNLEILDSILVNGRSPRHLSLSQNEAHLYCGVRSSKSLVKIDLSSRKLEAFFTTENIPGPVFNCDSSVYMFQSENQILGKFNSKNLQHLESRTVNYSLRGVAQKNSTFKIVGTTCFKIQDTLSSNINYYTTNALDSSGRYTWVINSYTNPKWALAQMQSFKQNGIKCYLSNLTDGYYRLCAGLYQNQEVAVAERAKHQELFDGSWLMTIHPHKF